MMFKTRMIAAESDDATLVAASLGGERDAFAEIVSRYQSLICSLAYNATGSLTESEDLAQETFLIAWRELKNLREPHKIRPWLCGIARNLISNAVRRNQRQPVERAESLDSLSEYPASERSASEGAIRQEEEVILWRSLERIPEHYREPLILFYREGESIERVAQQLDISSDTVKQRLSRGRKMLADEVTAFVEGALRQSTPGRAFTLGVISSLPLFATSASAATVAAGAAKGSAVAGSSTVVSIFSAILGPVIGLFGAYAGVRASIEATRTPREREFMVRQAKRSVFGAVLFNIVMGLFLFAAVNWWKAYPMLFGTLGVLFPLVFVAWIFKTATRTNQQFREIRTEEQALHPELYEEELLNPRAPREYRSKQTFLGLPLIHVCNGVLIGNKSKPAVGWIAIGECAYGILFAAGAVAVGGVAMGGVSVGVIAFGGAALGVVSIAGLAIGGIALGGVSVGVVAMGGVAIAWLAAQGGLAVAANYALGGEAIAAHANDAVAREFFQNLSWLDIRNLHKRNLFILLNWSPLLLFIWFIRRKKRSRNAE